MYGCDNDDYDRCFPQRINKSTKLKKKLEQQKKLQCRSAAKTRRDTETELFAQLTESLPIIDYPSVYQLDRIGALRLALSMCRLRRMGEKFFAPNSENDWCKFEEEQCGIGILSIDETLSQASMDDCFDGFLLIVNKIGRMLFVTPGVVRSVGFTQIDLIGRYLREYVHKDDWRDLKNILRMTKDDNSKVPSKTFFRMKTALMPRGGRARKLTLAVYQPFQAQIVDPSLKLDGVSFESFNFDEGGNATAEMDEDRRLIHCVPFTFPTSQRPCSNTSAAIKSRHDLDMRFRVCDDSFTRILGYKNSKILVGKSFFEFVHPEDVKNLTDNIREMYSKCHNLTGYYRLLDRSGGSIWVTSELFLSVQNSRGVSHRSVTCSHEILSESKNQALKNKEKQTFRFPFIGMEPDFEEINAANEIDRYSNYQILIPTPANDRIFIKPIGVVVEPPKTLFMPFISLTSFEDDPEMPYLLPAFYDQWLTGNPIRNDQAPENDRSDKTGQEDVEIGRRVQIDPITVQTFLADDGIPLDFSDVFGVSYDENQFSMEEFEKTFSQFDDLPPTVVRSALTTPTIDKIITPAIDDFVPSRKMFHSVSSILGKKISLKI